MSIIFVYLNIISYVTLCSPVKKKGTWFPSEFCLYFSNYWVHYCYNINDVSYYNVSMCKQNLLLYYKQYYINEIKFTGMHTSTATFISGHIKINGKLSISKILENKLKANCICGKLWDFSKRGLHISLYSQFAVLMSTLFNKYAFYIIV